MDDLKRIATEEITEYSIIPEYNAAGRLCNYHWPSNNPEEEGLSAIVPAEEWERFNLLAGRRHEIIAGVVAYNEALCLCAPDMVSGEPSRLENLEEAVQWLLQRTFEK